MSRDKAAGGLGGECIQSSATAERLGAPEHDSRRMGLVLGWGTVKSACDKRRRRGGGHGGCKQKIDGVHRRRFDVLRLDFHDHGGDEYVTISFQMGLKVETINKSQNKSKCCIFKVGSLPLSVANKVILANYPPN